ncbi:MAG: PKD domain-containing protein, partial [Bacteroidota bacterium]
MKKIFNILFVGVCILASHGCSDKDFPVPPASTVPKFSFTGDSDFAPVTILFKNESVVPKRAGTVSYIWNFGDGTSSTEESPSHFYKLAGVYNVNLVVISTTSNEINESSSAVIVKDPNEKGTPMYFTDGSVVYSGIINDKPPVMASIGISTLQDSYGMAFDTVNNKLYIADFDGSKIYTADPDGS